MLRWLLFLSVLSLLLTASAFGQGCAVVWYYLPENGPALTSVCQAGLPLTDGYPIKIMWDADSDGPDVDDGLAVLCTDPPVCELGPNGTCNINEMPFNGLSLIGLAGYFYNETPFQSFGSLPSPPRFFLRVYEPDGVTPLWTSIVYTLASGPQEIFVLSSDWTCGAGGAQCVVIDEQE